MRIRIFGTNTQSFAELVDCLVGVPNYGQSDTKIVVSHGILGLAPQRPLVMIYRILPLALEAQHVCQIGISLCVIGVDIEGFLEMRSSFIQSALFHQRLAETVFSNLVARSVGESLMPHCFAIPPCGGLEIGDRNKPCDYRYGSADQQLALAPPI